MSFEKWKSWATIYDAWKTLKDGVEEQIKIAKSSYTIEIDPDKKERKRSLLNDLFKSQHELEHMLIKFPEEDEI